MTEELCLDCGRPRSEHETDYDYALDDRKAFKAAVARRVEEKLAEHRYFAALVEYKMAMHRDPNQTLVPRPRTDGLDRLEFARIRKLAEARDFKHLVDQRVQAVKMARGDAEFIVPPGSLPTRPSKGLRLAMFGPNAKDVEDIEFRDGPV